jgi:hypothetical protein
MAHALVMIGWDQALFGPDVQSELFAIRLIKLLCFFSFSEWCMMKM